MSREDIVQALTQDLGNRPEILFAYLFGSFVEGGAFRDVDVAIYLGDQAADDLQYAIRLGAALERLIGSPVDLVVLNKAPDHLVHHVSKGKLLLDRDPEAREDFVARAWSRYMDYQPARQQAVKDLFT